MDQDRKIKAFSVVRTGAKSGVSADKVLHEVLEKAGLKREDISWIVSTGYGRVSIEFADENVTEISCHGKGAHYFNPNIRTILDIGGQDSKAIRLSESGEVKDFVMNDKCAAGTGRFLEMIARTLEVSLDELGAIALTSEEKIEITSMCSVFAESEVISLIANNKEKADIADGVCHAIANKASGLLRRVGMEPEFMMTGGVAKNPGVVRAVEESGGREDRFKALYLRRAGDSGCCGSGYLRAGEDGRLNFAVFGQSGREFYSPVLPDICSLSSSNSSSAIGVNT